MNTYIKINSVNYPAEIYGHVRDRVTYNGRVYESTMDGNTWSPDAYPQGWTEVTA